MPARRPVALADAFGLARQRSVWLIGGGGKTSLMYAMAAALVADGRTVLSTTSTRIHVPEPAESPRLIVDADPAAHVAELRDALAAHHHVTLAATARPDDKLGGFAVEALDALIDARVADHVLVEADGSAGRPLKAHAAHEPVLSPHAGLVVAVIGVACLGAPTDDVHVHRAALFCERLGLAPGERVTAEHVAAIVLHRDGYLARVGAASAVAVFLAGARDERGVGDGERIAAALRERYDAQRIGAIVIGDTRTGSYGVCPTHRTGPEAS